MNNEATGWQQRFMKWKKRVGPQLYSGHLADCSFEVGVKPNIFTLSAHKLILAASSPVFEKMFYGPMAEKNDCICIPDIEPEVFKDLLEYIYTDNVNRKTTELTYELYYAAKKYMLPGLIKKCSEYLVSKLDHLNACKTFQIAQIFEDKMLIDACLKVFKVKTREILRSSIIEEVDLNTILTIFSLDHMNIGSELELFQTIELYAKSLKKSTRSTIIDNEDIKGYELTNKKEINDDLSPAGTNNFVKVDEQKQTSTPPSDDVSENNEESMKVSIRNVVEKIRFLTMTPKEFVEGPVQSDLLTKHEAYALLTNIISSIMSVPIPKGFSTSRVLRTLAAAQRR